MKVFKKRKKIDFISDDIYSEEYRDYLIDAGGISSAEAGFMQGYEGA